ncbi:MAG: hypothetical protein K1000chlam3_00020 [Chlamydiae bacterium]|nr:hypothetical protein [Chlamydiota bacterium]
MKNFLAIFLLSFLLSNPCFSNSSKNENTLNPKIELLTSMENIDFYLFKVSGFDPGEKLHICSKSLHEVIESDVVMSPTEYMMLSSSPAVKGCPEGDATITIHGEKGEKVSYELHWTNPSFSKSTP